MKSKLIHVSYTVFLSVFILLVSCKKSSSKDGSNALSIDGTWQTTVFGGANDTINVAINSSAATGIIVFIGKKAATDSKFALSDVLFTNIVAAGTNTYSAIGTYRYGVSNASVSHANATLTLTNATTLYVKYALDASTGVTPPEYYYYKQ